MPLPYKIIAALLASIALAAAVLGYGHRQYAKGVQHTTALYETAIATQKAEAATRLADETEKTRQQELALQAATRQQEIQDANHQKIVADLSGRLRAAGPLGRLRDPNSSAARCWPGSGGTQAAAATAPADRSADAAEAPGLLSAQLTGLLQRLQREADDINDAYASCRADTYAVRGSGP